MGLSKLKEKLMSTLNPSSHDSDTQSSAPTSSTPASQATRDPNTLTELEENLESHLGVSDAEKQRAAEERRQYIREYLRMDRDKSRWQMYGGQAAFQK